jgi:hypothetical protein
MWMLPLGERFEDESGFRIALVEAALQEGLIFRQLAARRAEHGPFEHDLGCLPTEVLTLAQVLGRLIVEAGAAQPARRRNVDCRTLRAQPQTRVDVRLGGVAVLVVEGHAGSVQIVGENQPLATEIHGSS